MSSYFSKRSIVRPLSYWPLTLPVMFEFRTRGHLFFKKGIILFLPPRGTERKRNPIPKIHLLPSLLFDTLGRIIIFFKASSCRRCFDFLLDRFLMFPNVCMSTLDLV